MIKLGIILLLVLIVLMIIQTALFVTDSIIARIKGREIAELQHQMSVFQEQLKNAQFQYFNDVQTLRASNNNLSEELNMRLRELQNRNSIIRHQDLLIKAYKRKVKGE